MSDSRAKDSGNDQKIPHEFRPELPFNGPELLKQGHDTFVGPVFQPDPLSRNEFVQAMLKNFDIIDSDKDQTLSRKEVDDFYFKQSLTSKDKEMASVLRDQYNGIADLKDDGYATVEEAENNKQKDFVISKADTEVLTEVLSRQGEPSMWTRVKDYLRGNPQDKVASWGYFEQRKN